MKAGKILFGFISGFVVGASVVVLLTPWSGEEVRETLRIQKPNIQRRINKVKKEIEKLEKQLENRSGEGAVQEKEEA